MNHQSFRKGSFGGGGGGGAPTRKNGLGFFWEERYVRFLREIWWGCPKIIIYTDMDENGIMKKKRSVCRAGPFWPAAQYLLVKTGLLCSEAIVE